MALQKQNVPIPFVSGIAQKSDPLQNPPIQFDDLVNVVFTKNKRIQKRNGFSNLSSLPLATNPTTLATFKGNLVAIGSSIQALNAATNTWVGKGAYQPLSISTKTTYRSSSTQANVDSASAMDTVCTVFTDGSDYKYLVSNLNTTQSIVGPITLPAGSSLARVAVLGNAFVITFLRSITGTIHLQYIAIPILNPSNPSAATDLSTLVKSIAGGYDILVEGSFLYFAFNGSDGGGAVRVGYMDKFFNQYSPFVQAGETSDLVSLAWDASGSGVLWVSYYTIATTSLKTMSFNSVLIQQLAPTTVDATKTRRQLTSTANVSLTIYSEVSNLYPSGVRSDYIDAFTVQPAGAVSGGAVIVRGVGLASKAFLVNNKTLFVAVYQDTYQPTYIIIQATPTTGSIVGKVAAGNAGGYPVTQVLPSVTVSGSLASFSYLFKSTVQPVNKSVLATQAGGIYSALGVNLAILDLTYKGVATAEIGGALHIAGGFLWMYDGLQAVEHGFQVYPSDITVATSATGGTIGANTYFYQVTYEWTDAQGNIHKSSPSVPIQIVTTGATSSNTLVIPTLRLTLKTSVRIVIYRWSQAQPVFYQITSPTSPLLNDPSVDTVSYVDTQADSAILGNLPVYTTGGVVENIAAPPCSSITLFNSRLFLINSEDPNQVWYSKQVIEAVPVEMSDLFTQYTAPTTGVSGSTGDAKSLAPMDDKLILGKASAFYYMTGNGPDNTGANNDFSNFTYISGTVGCEDQKSYLLIPQGLIYKSEKGFWLLGRDLSTNYIGAEVQDYNPLTLLSTLVIPGTNQARICLSDKTTLMYDYYYYRWARFDNIDAISSTVYQSLHTYLTPQGVVRQETPGLYLDGSYPVLMGFTTSWYNFAGLQGFERVYQIQLLGNYLSPHKLYITLSFDYNSGPSQQVVFTPSNKSVFWGSDNVWGAGVWGGGSTLEQFRIFPNKQKLQSIQLRLQEVYDSSQGVDPGAGLTISGLNVVAGLKKGFVPLPASQSVG